MHSVESLMKLLNEKGSVALEGVPEAIYHALPAMSASGLKEFRKAPGYWKYARENPSDDTPARRWGRLVHAGIGEKDRFAKTVICVDGVWSGAVKKEIEALTAAGKFVCKTKEFDQAKEVVEFCNAHPLVSKLLHKGSGERTLLWFSETANGKVPCKARLDWTTESDYIADWKTFDEVHDDDKIEYQIRKMFYQFQAAWYLDGFYKVYGRRAKGFLNVFIQTEPVDLAVREISKQSLEEAVPYISSYLDKFAKCLATNTWPLTPPTIGEIVVRPFWN